jgi:hypothetical protein
MFFLTSMPKNTALGIEFKSHNGAVNSRVA